MGVRAGPLATRITGGTLRGRTVRSSKKVGLRPTPERVRGAIFSIIGPGAVVGTRVLDLYAGTGVLGIEALSRGASWADFVESDQRRSQDIRACLAALDITDRGHVYRARVERALDILKGGYDVVFADPPYDHDPWDRLMGRLGTGDLLGENAVVVVEHQRGRELQVRYGGLDLVTHRQYGDTSIRVYQAGGAHG